MTENIFDELVKESCEQIKEILIVKGKEYRRNNNVFHNFEKGAAITGKTREEVLFGFALKHQVSIADMREDLNQGKLPTIEAVEEKFGDAIIYLILEKASFIDRIKNNDPF
jgi:hypothetical protein